MYPSLFTFCMGILLVHFSPSPFVALTIFVAAFFLVCVFYYFFKVYVSCSPKHLLMALLAGLFGTSYASLQVMSHLSAKVGELETGDYASIQGYVCDIPVSDDFGMRVGFCTDRGRYLLSLPHDVLRAESGMCWQGRVKLKAPRSSFNPWAGSYERYLFAERIVGFAYAKTLESAGCTMQQRALSLVTEQRWRLKLYLESRLHDFDHAGVVIALVLGHRAGIDGDQSEVLRVSGTQHLMAISGLHVGIVCWLVFWVLQKVGVRRFVFSAVAVVGLVYIAMVGFAPSAQRAYVMMLCAMAVLSGRVPGTLWSGYLLASVLVLLIDPLAPLSPGFWFSFVAVFWLILIYHMLLRDRSLGLLVSMIIVQCTLALGLVPIQSHFSMPASLFSLPANLVAIPWVSFVVLPLSLLATPMSSFMPEISGYGFSFIDAVLDGLFAFLSLGLEFELGASTRFEQSGGSFLVFGYCLLLVFALMLARLRVFSLSAGLLLLTIMLVLDERSVPAMPESQFVVLDVGQGLSLVVQHAESIWIYDTGPGYAKYSSAKSVLASFIRRYARQSDNYYLIVSHGDADHASDAAWLAAKLRPSVVLLGEPERTALPKKQASRACMAGQNLGSDDFSMAVLWPLTNPPVNQERGNGRSCVVRFTLLGHRFLLMGDLEGKDERAFIRHYVQANALDELDSDVLIAGHHGARAATHTALLKHVKPSYVVFSAGYGNRFKHPSLEARERAVRFGAEIVNTADTGALTFSVSDVEGLVYSRARDNSNDYWLAR